MPTVLSFDGLSVRVYSNDHRPAHVHVIGSAGKAAFNLHCPEGPPMLRESFGFRSVDLSRIENELTGVLAALCAKWRAIHGDY
jgi:hypothetical protein